MYLSFKKIILVFSAFLSAGLAMVTTGCASGGYSLSRGLAGWINKQNIFLRIILYLFIGGAFFFTILLDMLIFNTVDFWTGRVSAGTYEFKDAKRVYVVNHSFEGDLHRTQILVNDLDGKKIGEVLLKETASHEVEYFENGNLKAKFDGIESVPRVTRFDDKGQILKQEALPEHVIKKVAAN